MTVLSRVFLAVYSLLFIALCAGFVGLLWNDSEMLDIELGDLNFQAFFVPGAEDAQKWAFTALMAAFVLLGLATFVLAFTRSTAGGGRLRLRQADGGVLEVGSDAIEALLRDELERLPEVRQAHTRVRVSGNVIDPTLTLVVEPSSSIAHVTNEAAQVTARALREQVGVANVRRPTMKISYDEIASRPIASGRARPQHIAPAPPPPAEPSVEAPPRSREPLFPASREPEAQAWRSDPPVRPSSGELEWREGRPDATEVEQAPDDER